MLKARRNAKSPAAAVRTVNFLNTCPATRRRLSDIDESNEDFRQSDPGPSNQSVANAPVLNTIPAEAQRPLLAKQPGSSVLEENATNIL